MLLEIMLAELGATFHEHVLEVGIGGGTTTREKSQLGENRGCRTDGRDLATLPGETDEGGGKGVAGLEVGRAGDAPRQHEHESGVIAGDGPTANGEHRGAAKLLGFGAPHDDDRTSGIIQTRGVARSDGTAAIEDEAGLQTTE